MSSSVSIAKAYLAEKLGAKQTIDKRFQKYKQRLQSLEEYANRLRARADDLYRIYKISCESLTTVTTDLKSMFEDAKTRGQKASEDLKNVLTAISKERLPLLDTYLKERVRAPIQQFLDSLLPVKRRMDHREELRRVFDHYARKLVGLYEARDKLVAKNKIVSQKDMERLSRNEEKHSKSREAYRESNREVITEMVQIWRTRGSFLDSIFQELVFAQAHFLQLLAGSFMSFRVPMATVLSGPPIPEPEEDANDLENLDDTDEIAAEPGAQPADDDDDAAETPSVMTASASASPVAAVASIVVPPKQTIASPVNLSLPPTQMFTPSPSSTSRALGSPGGSQKKPSSSEGAGWADWGAVQVSDAKTAAAAAAAAATPTKSPSSSSSVSPAATTRTTRTTASSPAAAAAAQPPSAPPAALFGEDDPFASDPFGSSADPFSTPAAAPAPAPVAAAKPAKDAGAAAFVAAFDGWA